MKKIILFFITAFFISSCCETLDKNAYERKVSTHEKNEKTFHDKMNKILEMSKNRELPELKLKH